MWTGMERRRFARSDYPCLIILRKDKLPEQSILTHTENISAGGVEVVIAKKINTLTEIDLEIDLKDTLPNVFTKGVVRWAQETFSKKQKGKSPRYDTGIQFLDLKEEYKRRIQNIIDNYFRRKG